MKHIKFIKEKYNYKDMHIVNLGEIRASLIAFPGGSVGKDSACNVGDLGSIPRLGRSPGEGNIHHLQSCLCMLT